MLTLKQINEVSFRKSNFSGYKPEDVDDFIDEVSESYGALIKENQAYKAKAGDLAAKNAEMREKLTILAQKIESYRADEDGIKNALLSAQRLGSASIREAKLKAESITADANVKADEMVQEAKKRTIAVIENYQIKIEDKKREYEAVKAAVASFRTSLFEMYRQHLNSIEAIPGNSSEVESQLQNREAQVKINNATEYEYESETEAGRNVGVNTEPAEDDFAEPVAAEDIEEIEEIPDDLFADYEEVAAQEELAPESVTRDTFGDIDFDAYSDIPEVLKKDKAKLYSTLEFGDDVDVKKK